jgi:hypothetical protein
MKIKIIDRFTPAGQTFYEWWLYEGPDGIEEIRGYATDLITAFSKILEWRERIGADYAAEITADVNISNNLPQSNETN